MEARDKKRVVVVAAILVLAGVIFFVTGSDDEDGIESIPADEIMTLMCRNERCGHVYEMEKRAYYELIEEVRNPQSFGWPRIECPKCSRKTIDRAVKCEKCGNVFFMYSVPNDFPDKCPKCGFSKSAK